MPEKPPPLAKISRPTLTSVISRARLYKLLDTNNPVQFISAPAGAGKTTLVSSYLDFKKHPFIWYRVDSGDSDAPTFFHYLSKAVQKTAPMERPLPSLTPEYLSNISTFTRRFFEELYNRLGGPSTIVFDSYQEVPVDDGFHEIMKNALDVIPDGTKVIIISRSAPPRQFIRLQANTKMNVIEWETISLTMEETKAFVELINLSNLTNKELHQLYSKTKGWPVGIILYLKGAALDGMHGLSLDIDTPEAIFNYFALEVFYKLDEETTDFLLKSVYLSKMTPAMAKELTGLDKAESILSDLNRMNCFTEKRLGHSPIYQYHPLFHEFLLLQSREKFTPFEISQIQHRCADILEKSGVLEKAVALFYEVKNWERILPLILSQARALAIQGRIKVLEEWIKRLPLEMVEANPWLLYWLGICQIPFSPEKSAKQFEKSFEQFHASSNVQGAFLAWAGAVESIILGYTNFKQLDRWFDTFDELMKKYGNIPEGEIEARVVTIMADLCAKALEAGIEVSYVQELIRRRGLVLEKPPVNIDLWPWPIKIYTLGYFTLVKDGRPVQFSRKAQKKPMEMLKAVIALGGRGIKEEELTDLLWPDADGDKAHWAFDTTLRRLRKLLGDEKTIQHRDGEVALDQRRCWVDAWAFERILGEIEQALRKGESGGKSEKISGLLDKTMKLYHGHFLGNGSDNTWAVSHREKLRSKFLRLLGSLGAYFCEMQECEQAIVCYQKGLEVDPLAEDLYQRLMKCYQCLNRRPEAIAVYKRCNEILQANLMIEPSSRTQAIYEAILAESRKRRVEKKVMWRAGEG